MNKSKTKAAIYIVTIVSFLGICLAFYINKNEKTTTKNITNSATNLNSNSSFSPTISAPSLEIVSGWKFETERSYSYVRGSVKNTGTTPIKYFKVVAKYKDSNGNVLDSDYTNSNETILPGEQKQFEIMHKDNDKFASASLSIEEVR